MHFPAYALAAGVLTGILSAAQLMVPSGALWAALIWGYGSFRIRGVGWAGIVLFLTAFMLGTASVSNAEKRRSQETLHLFAPAECMSVEGVVRSLPALKRHGRRERVQFVLSAERLLRLETDCIRGKPYALENAVLHAETVSGRLQVFLVNPASIPEPGDRVRVFGRMDRPHAPRNPGEMDYRRYLDHQGIAVIFSGLGSASLVVLERAAVKSWSVFTERLRQRLAQRMDTAFAMFGSRYAGMMQALILGIRSNLPEDLRDKMMRTGTAHLIAISGLHMTVFSASAYALIFFLLRRRRLAAAGALAFSILYVFIAGCGLPVQRAAVMGGAVYTAWMLERRTHALHLLAWACVVLLLLDPFAVSTVSFQLSFLSVFFLLLLSYLPPAGIWLEALRATVWVIAGTLPAAAWHFNRISWSAVPANLWAVSFFNLALLSGAGALASAEIPVIGPFFSTLSVFFLKSGLAGIEMLAAWQNGWRFVPVPSVVKVLHYYFWMAAVFVILKHRRVNLVVSAAAAAGWCAAVLLFFLPSDPSSKQILFLAGSRNLLVHLQSGGKHWFVNPGRPSPARETERKVLAYLKHRGIGRLEAMVLTGYGSGTARALSRLNEEIKIKKLMGPLPQKKAAEILYGTGMPWGRMGNQAVQAGDFSIRGSCRANHCSAVEIRLDGKPLTGWVSRLDGGSRHFFDCPKMRVPVLYFQGPAAKEGEEYRKKREVLVQACRTQLVLFETMPAEEDVKFEGVPHVDLARVGALRMRIEARFDPNAGNPAGFEQVILTQPHMQKDVTYSFRF